MLNPNVKFAKSKGIDLPLMHVYLAGYMSKNELEKCTKWRLAIRHHYRNWEYDHETEEMTAFPICFLDPFNGKEIKTISPTGVTSSIPAHAIRRGDKMSVNKADVLVINVDDFFKDCLTQYDQPKNFEEAKKVIEFLKGKITGHRPMMGTHHEIRWAGDMDKPRILIAPKRDLELYKNHPFTADCDYFFTSIEEMLEAGVLESFYKRIAGAVYEIPKGDIK